MAELPVKNITKALRIIVSSTVSSSCLSLLLTLRTEEPKLDPKALMTSKVTPVLVVNRSKSVWKALCRLITHTSQIESKVEVKKKYMMIQVKTESLH